MKINSDNFIKPWETKEWKQVRNKLLKKFCEECGSANSILVLKQNWKFPKYSQIIRETKSELINELISKNLIDKFQLREDEHAKFIIYKCPNCKSGSLRVRKVKLPKYICTHCKYEFQEPIKEIDLDDYRIKFRQTTYYNDLLKKYDSELQIRIKKKQKYYNQKYLSGKFTRTLCKRCAFAQDKGKVLCESCKKNYHSIKYEKCFICNSRPCIKCGKNRILLSSNKSICDECIKNSTEIRICQICKKNKIDPMSDLKLCDQCILEGHWME